MQNKNILKKLVNTRMLKNYGSWVYCNACDKTTAYLCYTTYDYFKFNYICNCGNNGSLEIGEKPNPLKKSKKNLSTNKGRLCCSNDQAPLFSVVDKNIQDCKFEIVCKRCQTLFNGRQINKEF